VGGGRRRSAPANISSVVLHAKGHNQHRVAPNRPGGHKTKRKPHTQPTKNTKKEKKKPQKQRHHSQGKALKQGSGTSHHRPSAGVSDEKQGKTSASRDCNVCGCPGRVISMSKEGRGKKLTWENLEGKNDAVEGEKLLGVERTEIKSGTADGYTCPGRTLKTARGSKIGDGRT